MGNQQERLSTQLAWLAAIVDGEGTICITESKKSYTPVLRVSNQDPNIIYTMTDILKQLQVPYHVSEGTNKTSSPWLAVTIQGLKRLQRFLPLLIPYLTGKKEEAELTQQFIDSRLTKGKRSTHPYTEEEHELYRRVKLLKKDRILRDYTPNPMYSG